MNSYSIIGLMSGTSMDGLDIAYCQFTNDTKGNWEYSVNQTKTVEFPDLLLEKIKSATSLAALDLLKLDKAIGQFFAKEINEFLDANAIDRQSIDAIASHGQTIFHQPTLGITHQIGCGQTIAYKTGIPVINDFRQKDVIAGGQGAPLVPIGDKLLFQGKAESFLNIGGFTNICIPGESTIAFDICPGNLPLNTIARQLGREYDANGEIASGGATIDSVFQRFNQLTYYSEPHPKSLGTEWLEEYFLPLLQTEDSPEDILRTLVEHIATQITNVLHHHKVKSVMITGGGAKNRFLIKRIESLFDGKVILPSESLIDFKEALIFAFLGALHIEKQPNCLASVTGASKNVIGGVLHLP